MSLKLLIADDEYFIRQRIKKIIPWEKLNLIFAGEAENGQQVIDHLEKEPVDLLLLDIKMPHMNGIETARYIKEHFPSVHILILSGYNDFEYARTAIRYGVKEYLLKPVAAEELERALSECIQAIHSEEQTRHTLKHYEHFHLCSMLANIRDGVLSYSDLCVQHPEFENLAYSIYCSVYVSEHTHDAVLQLVDRLRRQDFLCEYMQESEYIYMLQIFLSDKEKLLHIGSCFTDFIAQQNEYTFLYIENIFPVTTDWKPYYTRCLHLLHGISGNTPVLFPIQLSLTPAPTPATSPANSCPGISGMLCAPVSYIRGISEPHIPAARTLSSTSPAAG